MHAFVYVASYVRLPHRVNEPGEESFIGKLSSIGEANFLHPEPFNHDESNSNQTGI
jgi:hypothetical protein